MDLFGFFFFGAPLLVALIPALILYKKLKTKQSKWKWLFSIGTGVIVYLIVGASIAAVVVSQFTITRGGGY
ncbi:MAG: hypothetical protein ACI9U0_000002 [Flavobacteriales bacterium]|jgi:hypothetical protein|tara:strand:- start:30 stop:242 length:213 start_codon:yes stop_codon:yes gene_type:complete